MGAPRLSISSGAIIILVIIHMMDTMAIVRLETITEPGISLLPLLTSLVNNSNRKQLNIPLLQTTIVTKSL